VNEDKSDWGFENSEAYFKTGKEIGLRRGQVFLNIFQQFPIDDWGVGDSNLEMRRR